MPEDQLNESAVTWIETGDPAMHGVALGRGADGG